ncbi:unnamed protein product [Candida verbasci]|uniref:Arrestin-like N-terminal domain-containing protein n=1 Tax=Candida verbasci TaxID=1227364 RepID=A0A9W4TZ28_9ASCO|nr:unnamed protein product [Candida verbasci]
MSDVKVEIDRSETDGTFTNHDIIKGNITLVVTKSISLNWIQVKLEGVSSTQLSIPKVPINKKDRDRKDKILKDVHKVLYDTAIVFPPDNVRQVSSAKEFTLTPGNYSYPFEFKIPLNNSCHKLSGISNKLSFNLKTMDLMINNGNFNSQFVKNKAQKYYQDYKSNGFSNSNGNGSNNSPPNFSQPYHITSQLPPSLSGIGDFANIKYFIKVTCKRSSFIKPNLRAFDPFIFLPLDLDSHNKPIVANQTTEIEYREAFVRKELIFKNRIPEIVGVKVPLSPEKKANIEKKALPKVPVPQIQPRKQGFIQRLFNDNPIPTQPLNNDSPPQPIRKRRDKIPEIEMKNVPFSFEIRFRHPAFLIPTKPPSFKLYLVSNLNPLRYTLAEYGKSDESNGLGIVYLQKLKITLISTTIVSVIETDGSTNEYHMGQNEENLLICNNTYQNLKFDLMHCIKNRNASQTSTNVNNQGSIFEIEIPKKYFANAVLPDYLSPSFKTCNITRRYTLNVIGGFSCEKINDFRNKMECDKKIKYVDLSCPNIKVLSGLNMTSTLQSNASKSSIPRHNSSTSTPQLAHTPPPQQIPFLDDRKNSHLSVDLPDGNNEESVLLPTYDDVMRESSYQDNSEHQRARRRYQQHEQYYNSIDP